MFLFTRFCSDCILFVLIFLSFWLVQNLNSMHSEFSGVYIMGNSRPTLYTGVTNNLIRRVLEHQKGKIAGFAQKYGLKKCIYYEFIPGMTNAIIREKQIKNMKRREKLDLIKLKNPDFRDLSEELFSFIDDPSGIVTYDEI